MVLREKVHIDYPTMEYRFMGKYYTEFPYEEYNKYVKNWRNTMELDIEDEGEGEDDEVFN